LKLAAVTLGSTDASVSLPEMRDFYRSQPQTQLALTGPLLHPALSKLATAGNDWPPTCTSTR